MESGFTQLDVANSMLISLSGSFQTTPSFWLDPKNGVTYSVVTQTPQYAASSLSDLENIPISREPARGREILGDVVSHAAARPEWPWFRITTSSAPSIFSARFRTAIWAAWPRDINRIVDANRKKLPRGSQLFVRGQIETMRTSFQGLLSGLVLAIVLVYLLIVVNFQSWLDPFIILTRCPRRMAGIVIFLFVSRTTLSVPALMGAIMSVGVATANSILVVSFAKEHLAVHGDPVLAAARSRLHAFPPRSDDGARP